MIDLDVLLFTVSIPFFYVYRFNMVLDPKVKQNDDTCTWYLNFHSAIEENEDNRDKL